MTAERSVLNTHPHIRSLFYLTTGHINQQAVDEPELIGFLCWLATKGRKRFAGVRITPEIMEILQEPDPPYRSSLQRYVSDTLAPSSVRQTHDRFLAWYYFEGVPDLGLAPFVSPHERAWLHEADGPDGPLRLERLASIHYADLLGTLPDFRAFLNWFRSTGRDKLPEWLERPATRSDGARPPGVNVHGHLHAVMGLGEDARSMLQVLEELGAPRVVCDLPAPATVTQDFKVVQRQCAAETPLFDVNLFCLSPFETARLRLVSPSHFDGCYNVGYWPWELSTIPDYWSQVFDTVDEIWAPTRFVKEVFEARTRKPVFHVPPLIELGDVRPPNWIDIGIERKAFTALCLFDFNSSLARKNPGGAIEAFQIARASLGEPSLLILKTINGDCNPDAFSELCSRISADSSIFVLDRHLTRRDTLGLIAAADCLISLHRAEGFGRSLAEAMLLGTPVLTTGGTGPLDFVSPEVCWVVDHGETPVLAGEYWFHEGSVWSEPSIADAAAKLVEITRGGADVSKRTRAAKASISDAYGRPAVAARVRDRLVAIDQRRRSGRTSVSSTQ